MTNDTTAGKNDRWIPNYSNPVDNLTAFIKLQFSLDAAEFGYYYEGPVYGCLEDGALQPLFSYHSLLRYTVKPVGPQTWETNYRDAGYYGDLATGEPLASFKNPYTDRSVEPIPFVEGPGPSTLSPTESVWGKGSSAVVTKRDFHYPLRNVGNTVWLEYDIMGEVPNPLQPKTWPLASTGETIPISSVSLFRGNRAAIEDPGVRTVKDTRFYDHSVLPWMPWMLMGGHPGSLLFQGAGRKIWNFSDIPAQKLAALKRLHPEHFLPPHEWKPAFETVWTQFEQQRKPQ